MIAIVEMRRDTNPSLCAVVDYNIVREECLDKLLIIKQRHLRRVLREYIEYFRMARRIKAPTNAFPFSPACCRLCGRVHCRNVLGGIVHDYYRDAA